MANQGRIALLRAIRYMSRAAAALTTAELPPALTHERAALAQPGARVLAHTNHPARADRARATRSLASPHRRAHRRRARRASDRECRADGSRHPVARRVGRHRRHSPRRRASPTTRPPAPSALGERVLRVDASAKPLQDVATLLNSAGDAIAHARTDEARTLLDRAATSIAAALRGDLLDAPTSAPSSDVESPERRADRCAAASAGVADDARSRSTPRASRDSRS